MSVHVNSLQQYKDLLKENSRVIVDFTATWCGPCKTISPVFEELAKKTPNVRFLKVDVDECSDVAQDENIQSMPTFLAYHNGVKFDNFSGANPAKLSDLVGKLNGLN